jgi:hypothetical protein
MDARPAVNRPPLCTPSPILGSGSLVLLPVRDCAPASPKGRCLVRLQAEAPPFPAMAAPARPRSAADAHGETRRPAVACATPSSLVPRETG